MTPAAVGAPAGTRTPVHHREGCPLGCRAMRRPLLAYVKSISGPRDLAQIAWNFINDSLRTTICLQVRTRVLWRVLGWGRPCYPVCTCTDHRLASHPCAVRTAVRCSGRRRDGVRIPRVQAAPLSSPAASEGHRREVAPRFPGVCGALSPGAQCDGSAHTAHLTWTHTCCVLLGGVCM